MEEKIAIELSGISKHFGEVYANKNVNLALKKGEILSLLGENGSGKTTLMNMISGIYFQMKVKFLLMVKKLLFVHQKMPLNIK